MVVYDADCQDVGGKTDHVLFADGTMWNGFFLVGHYFFSNFAT